MDISDYHLDKAYVLSTGNIDTHDHVIYLPIYMCYLLKEQETEQLIIELDTEGL